MQSLSPGRAQIKRRGSQDPLLARGIAVPRGSSRRVPALSGVRSVLRRSPKAVRLGKLGPDRVRGKWLVLCLLFLATAVAYGAWLGGQTSKIIGLFTGGIEHLAVAAGFGVKRVTVEGQLHATDADITAALNAGPDTILLGFDTDAAKARLEAVPWIRHAQVMRFLPSTLQVAIEERTPYAVWQKDGQTYVVDDEGAVLTRALRDAYFDLPLVVGEGAGKSASQLFAVLVRYPGLKEKIIAAIRVGEWDWAVEALSEWTPPDAEVAQFAELFGDQAVLMALRGEDPTTLLDRVTRMIASLTDPQFYAYESWFRAWAAFSTGQFTQAVALAARAPKSISFFHPLATPLAARAALWANDVALAREHMAGLDRTMLRGEALDQDKKAIAASIAAIEGRPVEAMGLYREALAGWRRLELAWDEALTAIDMVKFVGPGDPDVDVAAEWALTTLRRLRAQPYVERLEEAMKGSTVADTLGPSVRTGAKASVV